MRTQAIQITDFGGPEVLKATDIEIGEPAQGEVRVRHQSVAVNFVDVYHRIGQLHGDGPKPPFIAGVQANGVIEALGEGLAESDLRVGAGAVVLMALLICDLFIYNGGKR